MWSERGWGAGPGLQPLSAPRPPVLQGCAPGWCGEGVTLQACEALPEVDLKGGTQDASWPPGPWQRVLGTPWADGS